MLLILLKLGRFLAQLKDGRISSASRIDYAEAAAKVLTSTGHENKTYELAGSESFTKAEFGSIHQPGST